MAPLVRRPGSSFDTAPLEDALQTAIALARPEADAASIALVSCDGALVAAPEIQAIRAIHAALLAARAGDAALEIRATRAGSIARVRIEPVGGAEAEAPSAAALARARAVAGRITLEGRALVLELAAVEP